MAVLESERLIIVIQKIRQLRMQKTAIKLTSRSAVRSRDCSALQPDFKILWNVSIFQRDAYHSSFSMACKGEETGKSVRSFQSMESRSCGVPSSQAWMTVRVRLG